MRIGIDIRAIGRKRTGDETYTLGLVRQLLSQDRKNSYFLYTNTEDRDETKEIKKLIGEARENVKIVSITPGSKMLWTFFLLPRQARKDKIDVLHVQYITPLTFLGKTALVTTIHDVSFKKYPQFINKKDLFFLNTLIPLSLKKAKGIIAVSNFTKKEIVKFYGTKEAKVAAIQNGCDAKVFSRIIERDQKEKFLNEHKLDKPYLLYVGTLQPRKNVSFLIAAFAKLKADHEENELIKNLQLVIGGSKSGRNYDQEIDNILDGIEEESIKSSIRFEGYIEPKELPFFYQCAKAYVNASLYEGFGLPLLEAMASGTPVICSKDSCFPEVAGDAATFFENNDKESFCLAVMKVLRSEEEREKKIEKGKKRAKLFSWEENALQTLNFYDTIVQELAKQASKKGAAIE